MTKPDANGAQARKRLEEINRRYREPLRRFFLKRVQDFHEAEDLTQDLLVKLAQKADTEPLENAESYLFTAAANLLRDRARHQRTIRRVTTEFSSTYAETIEGISPERVLVSKQSLLALLNAHGELDKRVRDVFILHRLEGMKYAEIAKLYGLSVSSIEKDIIKALAHLAKHMAKL